MRCGGDGREVFRIEDSIRRSDRAKLDARIASVRQIEAHCWRPHA